MSALRTHFAAGLLALILALLASPPGAAAHGVKSRAFHAAGLADHGVLAPSGDAADVDDDDSSPGGEPPESGAWALCAQGPLLGLDPSGRVDLARSYTGPSPARYLRRGSNSPPGCPP
jgi:hypothetical protein